MPLTSRQNVLTMSPELIQKFEAASKAVKTDSDNPGASSENIACALEKTLDNGIDIVRVDEKKIETANEHIVLIDCPKEESAEESTANQNNILINVDSGSVDNVNGEGLFEVSVDISEPEQSESDHDTDSTYSGEFKRYSLTQPYHSRRRSSRWSATVLFLASDVQMMVNLAQLSPPEGYELAPKRVSVLSNLNKQYMFTRYGNVGLYNW